MKDLCLLVIQPNSSQLPAQIHVDYYARILKTEFISFFFSMQQSVL